MAVKIPRTYFEKLKAREGDTERSVRWYKNEINKLGYSRFKTEIMTGRADKFQINTMAPGRMIFFAYDPKHKATLPVYDMFPLVFPFASAKGGFLGINLHYLPYGARLNMLAGLDYYTDKYSYSEQKTAQISWEVLKHFSNIENCVKHYLYDHIQTVPKSISKENWRTAAMLPLHQFVKKTDKQVWGTV